jgi:hypothetical protein
VFVQAAVEVVKLPVETVVRPTTLGYPSQRVMEDVTLVEPARRWVSVKLLANVEVPTMASSHPYQKEDLLQVESASWHFDAYSNPVPVLCSEGVICGFFNVSLMPKPEAT